MDTQARKRPGRPRVNIDGDGLGNPVLRIRVPTEVITRIRSLGGSAWARKVIEEALANARA